MNINHYFVEKFSRRIFFQLRPASQCKVCQYCKLKYCRLVFTFKKHFFYECMIYIMPDKMQLSLEQIKNKKTLFCCKFDSYFPSKVVMCGSLMEEHVFVLSRSLTVT